MQEFDTTSFSQEELTFLRGNTKLGPISLLKINKAKKNAELYRKYILETEHELIEIDYSDADELEFELRLRSWENGLSRTWKQYPDGLSLSEFAEMVMKQQINVVDNSTQKR